MDINICGTASFIRICTSPLIMIEARAGTADARNNSTSPAYLVHVMRELISCQRNLLDGDGDGDGKNSQNSLTRTL